MSGGSLEIDPTVCILKRSFAILVLQEFSQGINFHFTQTTEHQPTRNRHSSTKLFAMTPAGNHFDAYLSPLVRENTKIFASTRFIYGCGLYMDFYGISSKGDRSRFSDVVHMEFFLSEPALVGALSSKDDSVNFFSSKTEEN